MEGYSVVLMRLVVSAGWALLVLAFCGTRGAFTETGRYFVDISTTEQKACDLSLQGVAGLFRESIDTWRGCCLRLFMLVVRQWNRFEVEIYAPKTNLQPSAAAKIIFLHCSRSPQRPSPSRYSSAPRTPPGTDLAPSPLRTSSDPPPAPHPPPTPHTTPIPCP